MPAFTAPSEHQAKAADSVSYVYIYCRAVVFYENHHDMVYQVLFLF